MIRVALVLLFVHVSRSIFLNCEYSNFDGNNPPVFLQKRYIGHRLLSSQRVVVFAHRADISAYCNPKVDDDETTNEIISLKCDNGTIEDFYDQYMSCEIEGFYRYDLEECPKQFLSYVSGLKVEDEFIIFQAVCYDEENLQTIFVKYTPKRRPRALSSQGNFNPVDANVLAAEREALKMPFLSFEVLGDQNITEQIRPYVGSLASTMVFTESSLVPSNLFKPYLTHQNKINTVIWWKPLRDGNWAAVQERLRKLQDIVIYAGTSGVLTAYNDYNEETDLWLRKTHGPEAVPLYIWNYVKTDSDTDDDVVIVGVNSPFVKGRLSREVSSVCSQDVCRMKSYLRDMALELKYPALGYIICCEPSKINVNVLSGIPEELLPTVKIVQDPEITKKPRVVCHEEP